MAAAQKQQLARRPNHNQAARGAGHPLMNARGRVCLACGMNGSLSPLNHHQACIENDMNSKACLAYQVLAACFALDRKESKREQCHQGRLPVG